MDYDDIRGIVKDFYPGFNAIKKYHGRNLVYLIGDCEDNYFILKLEQLFANDSKLAREVKALRNLKSVHGITHLVEDIGKFNYNGEIFYGLVKEFYPGRQLYYTDDLYGKIELKEELAQTISDVHNLGYSGLDIKRENIVTSEDYQNSKIIDLDSAICCSNLTKEEYELNKKEDSARLKMIFARY